MGNYRRVRESAPKVREIARTSLGGRWKEAVLFFAVYYLVTTFIMNILDTVFIFNQAIPTPLEDGTMGTEPVAVTYGSSIYSLIVGGPLSYGMSLFLLHFIRGKAAGPHMVFEGFSHFGKAFMIFLITTVKTALWACLFVIPGVIAAYNYSQAYLVAIDHPELTANQCIEESKKIMKGNKGSLFYLDLTFIGWYLLTSILSAALTFGSFTGIMGAVAALVAAIPVFFVDAYSNVARTFFYELAIDNVQIVEYSRFETEEVKTETDPVEEVKVEETQADTTETTEIAEETEVNDENN